MTRGKGKNLNISGKSGAVGTDAVRTDVAAFLQTARNMPPVSEGAGRLIFALDATMSRQPTWDTACALQGEMFAEADQVGGIAIQLIYFRGFGECAASKWVRSGDALGRLMSGIDCRGGHTQILKVLNHTLKQTRQKPVSALVYVGDCIEEKADDLAQKAGELGLLNVPVFVFQEGHDLIAEPVFREIARLSGGAWFRFDTHAAAELGALLRAVAAYAAGGRKALAKLTGNGATGAQKLLSQLK